MMSSPIPALRARRSLDQTSIQAHEAVSKRRISPVATIARARCARRTMPASTSSLLWTMRTSMASIGCFWGRRGQAIAGRLFQNGLQQRPTPAARFRFSWIGQGIRAMLPTPGTPETSMPLSLTSWMAAQRCWKGLLPDSVGRGTHGAFQGWHAGTSRIGYRPNPASMAEPWRQVFLTLWSYLCYYLLKGHIDMTIDCCMGGLHEEA